MILNFIPITKFFHQNSKIAHIYLSSVKTVQSFKKIKEPFCDALSDALGDALSDALSDVLSDALSDALGDALSDALGDALRYTINFASVYVT